MASASSLPCEEQLQCSICLEMFSEPVSTPCGHNYCKTCITEYWDSRDVAQCPLCKKKFRRRPQLQVNTGFRDMVEHFSSMRLRAENDIPAKPGEVPCGICLVPKLRAQKTCLGCLVSYCQSHLEQHQRVPTFKKHQLINPVLNLEDRVCQKHDKMFEYFCHMDQTCVCFMCLKDDHAMHDAVPLEHAFRERKTWLVHVMSEIKMMENSKSRSIKEIKRSTEQSKKDLKKEITDIAEVFTALVASLQRRQAELIELIQEKQKASEKQVHEHVTQLQKEVTELKRRHSEMEQLLQTEDHFRLLQSPPSVYTANLLDPLLDSASTFAPDPYDISRQDYVRMVKKAATQMENTLCNEMEMLIHEVRLSDGCKAAAPPNAEEKLMTDEFIKEVWSAPQDRLMMIQQCDAVDVTMDPYTANTKLMVSEDGKQLRYCDSRLFFTALFGRRFINLPFVLGKEGFSSGRFYYEVQISGSKHCVLGVVKESLNREIFSFPNSEDGAWTFLKMNDQYFGSFADDHLNLRQNPQTVGVFVDYEKGEVSFYDVDARTLIYSYKGCTFNETTPTLKAFLYSMAGSSLSSRPKLYPVFGLFDSYSNDVLVITPVAI